MPDGFAGRYEVLEDRGGGRDDERTKKVKETVPEDVLFRTEKNDESEAADEGELPPCESAAPSGQEGDKSTTIEIIPTRVVRQGEIKAPCIEGKDKESANVDDKSTSTPDLPSDTEP